MLVFLFSWSIADAQTPTGDADHPCVQEICIGDVLWQSGPAGLMQNPQWTILGPIGLLAWFVSEDTFAKRSVA